MSQFWSASPEVVDDVIMYFNEDPLTVMCNLVRQPFKGFYVTDSNILGYLKTLATNVTDVWSSPWENQTLNIADIDRDNADKVRKHFLRKIALVMIKGEVSNYRKKLHEVLSRKEHFLYESELGLLVRTLSFYKEDMGYKHIRDLDPHSEEDYTSNYDIMQRTEHKLTYVSTIVRKSRYMESDDFILKDNSDYFYRMRVNSGNHLKHLVTREFKRSPEVYIKSRISYTKVPGQDIILYDLINWEII